MGSRREEERNEKIIRGLMKLPPNRRCINCNSLGPQYVCTNFWTFICMTCSGIHREFTHRVKSVSMSKFTSEEVEALQNGGNQRAREMYLKGWDPSQRLPDNSNVDKVRDFIKSVYIDKRYAGGKSHDKPPRDLQRLRSHEDETRRASSYHSYSQSPPYDYQYEERRYGKQSGVLSRKPGSDRGLYLGKMSSFICSPTRLSERMFEDRFANEGSVSRVSDYSASSGGDLVIADSPNFVKDISHSSPPQTSRNVFGQDVHHQRTDLFSESNFKRDAERPPHPQRSASLGSIGSFDSNSVSVKSFNSSSVADVASDHEQATGTLQDQLSTTKERSGSVSCNSLDHIKAPVGPEAVASVGSSIDLFQLPAKSPAPPISFFEVSQLDPAPSTNAGQNSQNFLPASLDLFSETAHQRSVNSLDQCPIEQSFPKNEGWATFDTVPTTSAPEKGNLTSSVVTSSAYSSAKFEQASTLNGPMQWPPFQNTFQGSASGSSLWNNGPPNTQPHDSASALTWNAFDDSISHFPSEGATQSSTTQASYMLSSANWCSGLNASEDHSRGGTQNVAPYGQGELSGQYEQPDILLQPSYTTTNPVMEPTQSHASNHKPTNPFDLPYDSELETGNTFLDMSSLQAALPDTHLPSTFLGGVTEPWFPQDPVPSFIPNAPQGGLAYMSGQVPSNQLANVQTQGPVASVGGNPFA